VLDRIDVAIFDVAGVISFVSDQVLQKSALPNSAFAARLPHATQGFALWYRSCEVRLDQPPSQGKVCIAGRQAPHCVEMVRQHDEGVNAEGIALQSPLRSVAKGVDPLRQDRAASVEQIDGEEPAAGRHQCASIIGHA
jgi:hypothetical protein